MNAYLHVHPVQRLPAHKVHHTDSLGDGKGSRIDDAVHVEPLRRITGDGTTG